MNNGGLTNMFIFITDVIVSSRKQFAMLFILLFIYRFSFFPAMFMRELCYRPRQHFNANRPFLFLLTACQIPLFIGVYKGSEFAAWIEVAERLSLCVIRKRENDCQLPVCKRSPAWVDSLGNLWFGFLFFSKLGFLYIQIVVIIALLRLQWTRDVGTVLCYVDHFIGLLLVLKNRVIHCPNS